MLNKAMLIGNLGHDPSLRETTSGQPVAEFSVATSRKWKNKDGTRAEETEWHTVIAWGKQADTAKRYLVKGSKVYVEGHIKTRSWEPKDGGPKRYKTEIICDRFQMLGGNVPAEEPNNAPPAAGPDDSDIPF